MHGAARQLFKQLHNAKRIDAFMSVKGSAEPGLFERVVGDGRQESEVFPVMLAQEHPGALRGDSTSSLAEAFNALSEEPRAENDVLYMIYHLLHNAKGRFEMNSALARADGQMM